MLINHVPDYTDLNFMILNYSLYNHVIFILSINIV